MPPESCHGNPCLWTDRIKSLKETFTLVRPQAHAGLCFGRLFAASGLADERPGVNLKGTEDIQSVPPASRVGLQCLFQAILIFLCPSSIFQGQTT